LPNVQFAGFLERKQILSFLANAKFLLNTSHHEGFSNTFLEAWSVGTPVLSGVNVNPDSIISKYDLGLIYTDVFDLCRQFAAVTPEFYQLISANAKEYVAHYHGCRFLAGKLLRYLSTTDNIITSTNNHWLPLTDQTMQRQFLKHDAE
jgi:glycosyltransferase involved in cell wall biosynthesis